MTVGHIVCSAQEFLLAADGLQILLLIHFQVLIQALIYFQVQIEVRVQIQVQVQIQAQIQVLIQVLVMGKSLLCLPSNTKFIKQKMIFVKSLSKFYYPYCDFGRGKFHPECVLVLKSIKVKTDQ